jgi:MarR family 2-MHQ and catechol resistance regulon transcriptional repressor
VDNSSFELATTMEVQLPRVMRALFAADPKDPLVELQIAQLRMMRVLFLGDRTVSDLSEEFNLSMSACTQMVNRLESLGLVDRRGDVDDRRIRHIGLTDDGLMKMQARHKRRVERAEKLLSSLTDEARQEIRRALEILVEAAGPYATGIESLATTAELEHGMSAPPRTTQDASA